MATKHEGGGSKALVAGPLKNTDFFAASLTPASRDNHWIHEWHTLYALEQII